MLIDIDERFYHFSSQRWGEEVDKGVCAAISVPNGMVIAKIRFVRNPKRIFSCVVRWLQKDTVERGIEIAFEIFVCTFNFHSSQNVIPFVDSSLVDIFNVPRRN